MGAVLRCQADVELEAISTAGLFITAVFVPNSSYHVSLGLCPYIPSSVLGIKAEIGLLVYCLSDNGGFSYLHFAACLLFMQRCIWFPSEHPILTLLCIPFVLPGYNYSQYLL